MLPRYHDIDPCQSQEAGHGRLQSVRQSRRLTLHSPESDWFDPALLDAAFVRSVASVL